MRESKSKSKSKSKKRPSCSYSCSYSYSHRHDRPVPPRDLGGYFGRGYLGSGSLWVVLLLLTMDVVAPLLHAAGQPKSGKSVSGPAASLTTEEMLGVDREIWISLRTDGAAGEGTLASPFNGTGDRLDVLLRDLSVVREVTNLTLHFLPGTYETQGVLQWHPLTGWKIHGAGMDVTTLKLVNVSNNVYAVIHTRTGTADHVEVSDLTVDCNYGPDNPSYASAVILTGSQHAIRRVKAIHAYGKPPIENFTIGIGIGLEGPSVGNVIESCVVTDFAGFYCSAIAMGGGPEVFNTRYIEGTVRNNQVLDLHNPYGDSTSIAFGGGALENVVFEGNVTRNCDIAFNADTGRCRNLTFRGNRFLRCRVRGLSLLGRDLENVVVEDNLFEMDPASRDWAINCTDSGGVARLVNFKIRDNVVRSEGGFFSSAGGIAVTLSRPGAFLVTGNRVESALHNRFIGDGILLFDNTDFEGNPLHAPNAPGLPVQVPKGRAGTLMLDRSAAHVVVQAGPDPAANGNALLVAYQEAAVLRPHGRPPSATNRVNVLIYPGRYRLGDGAFQVTARFVDLVGVGSPEAIRLESDGNTLVQWVGEVRLENLTLHSGSTVPGGLNDQARAAYFPATGLAGVVVRNCRFTAESLAWSMRLGVEYAGTYEQCQAGARAFGSLGIFSGQATDCRAGDFSFGSGGLFSGAATHCAAGLASFGGATLIGGGGFHGFARNCSAGHDSFGGSGWMLDCDVAGSISAAVPMTGRMEDCRVGPSPGNQPAVQVGTGAALHNCTLLANPQGAGFSIHAATPVMIRVSHCRLNRGMNNVLNLIAEPYNVDDPNID